MAQKREIEFLAAGMFLVLLLIIILGILYFNFNEDKNKEDESLQFFEKHSKVIIGKSSYYSEETSREVNYGNDVYSETVSSRDFINLKNRILIENEYLLKRTSGESSLKIKIE